jgi:PAS domain S-box-containing protein
MTLNQLAEILEALPDFLAVCDPAGNVVYRNRALRDLGGQGQGPWAAQPPWAAREAMAEGLPAAVRDGSWHGETAFLDRSGRELPVAQLILAQRGADGQPAFLTTVARDLSAQVEAMREAGRLVKRLQDLRHAVDQSTIFAVTDAQGIIREVNARFCEVAGYAPEELLGRTHRLLNSGYHPRSFFQEMWDTIRAGRVWRGEIRNRAKDGSTYWVEGTIVPWLDEDGRPERFISLRNVITERKLAEEALLRRERQLELLSAASRELNQDLELPVVMRRLVETGLKLAAAASGTYGVVEGRSVRVREVLRDGRWEAVDLIFGEGQGIPGWVMANRRPCLSEDAAGDPRVGRESLRILGLRTFAALPILGRKGDLLGYFGIHNKLEGTFSEEDRDLLEGLAAHAAVALENARRIEAQRQEQEALSHARKLESLGLLVGGTAHDFNNLLAVVLGNMGLAQAQAPAGSDLGRALSNIDQAVTRASSLTQQMLAYAGKGRSQARRLDLNAAVGETAKLLEVSLPGRARLEFNPGRGLPALEADPQQIEQVVLSLVTNAADAIGDRDGTITLATGVLDHEEAGLCPGWPLAAGTCLVLEVKDDGCGIPPENLDRIFDPFFSTKGLGRGLGLSAMAGIVKAHRGGIRVESRPGRGSTIRIYLPAATGAAAEPEPEPRPEPAPWKGRGTVLVVDDDDLVRSVNRAQIELLGFRTLEAQDGAEAVEVFRRDPGAIDLVFMDLSMPRMDGREALRAMRALDPGARVILCSGFDEGTALPAAGAETPTAFLQKPFRKEVLHQALRAALERA